MQKNIIDLQNGDKITGVYLLKDAAIRQTKSGKDYLDATLSDRTGAIKTKLWDFKGDLPETGIPYDVDGVVSEYMSTLQATINGLSKNENPGADILALLVPASPEPVDKMLQDFTVMEDKYITDEKLRKMTDAAIAENLNKLKTVPAAKSVHHAYLGGLVAHVHEMLILEDMLLKAVDRIYKPYNDISKKENGDEIVVDKELLTVAIIFHDIGKIREFTCGKLGTVTEYSVEGHLLGHIYMSAEYVAEMCEKYDVDDEKSMLLQSMILSHHGKPEYGSAIIPQFLEAYLLHVIDEIDARLQIFREAYMKTDPGTVCPDKQWALDGVQPYRPSTTKQADTVKSENTDTSEMTVKEDGPSGGVQTLKLF